MVRVNVSTKALVVAQPQSCAVAVTSVLDARKYPDADAILPKPFTRAQVLHVLEECVPRWPTA